MNVVLFQRVCHPGLADRLRKVSANSPSIPELRRSIADEAAEILEELTEGRGTAKLKIAILAQRTGMTKRRVRSIWYREACRIEACEADLLRRLRAAHAETRVERLERELVAARALAGREAA